MSYDNSNIETANFVLQNADADGERGVPALGKIVYRTDTSTAELCTDTDPDPLENDGGTWAALGGGTGPITYTPTLSSEGGPVNLGSTGGLIEAYYWTAGPMILANAVFDFDGSGKDVGSGRLLVSLPVPCGSVSVGHVTAAGTSEFIGHIETVADPSNYAYTVELDAADFAFVEGDAAPYRFSFTAWYARS